MRYGYCTSCVAGFGRVLAFAGMIVLASAGLEGGVADLGVVFLRDRDFGRGVFVLSGVLVMEGKCVGRGLVDAAKVGLGA